MPAGASSVRVGGHSGLVVGGGLVRARRVEPAGRVTGRRARAAGQPQGRHVSAVVVRGVVLGLVVLRDVVGNVVVRAVRRAQVGDILRGYLRSVRDLHFVRPGFRVPGVAGQHRLGAEGRRRQRRVSGLVPGLRAGVGRLGNGVRVGPVRLVHEVVHHRLLLPGVPDRLLSNLRVGVGVRVVVNVVRGVGDRLGGQRVLVPRRVLVAVRLVQPGGLFRGIRLGVERVLVVSGVVLRQRVVLSQRVRVFSDQVCVGVQFRGGVVRPGTHGAQVVSVGVRVGVRSGGHGVRIDLGVVIEILVGGQLVGADQALVAGVRLSVCRFGVGCLGVGQFRVGGGRGGGRPRGGGALLGVAGACGVVGVVSHDGPFLDWLSAAAAGRRRGRPTRRRRRQARRRPAR